MIDEDMLYIIIFLFGLILATTIIIFGVIKLDNYTTGLNCNMIKEQGYETKIVKPFISNQCLININGKFIPLENWRSFDDNHN
jgi:hypothetical protein